MDYYNRISIAVLLVSAAGISYSLPENTWGMNLPMDDILYCPDLKPQPSLDLQQIMGEWYVVEVIEHKIDPMRLTSSGHFVVETCPTVRLRFTSRSSLGLLWSTEAGDLDYSFNVPDPNRGPGWWISKDLQNGTLLTKNYVHFVGVVQVMKAISSHMVLTFCSRKPDNQLYSILMSRERNLPENDIIGVRNLLERRNLTNISVKETCINAGSGKESSYVRRWTILGIAAAALAALASNFMTTIHITTPTSF